jgi:hypothetical protein
MCRCCLYALQDGSCDVNKLFNIQVVRTTLMLISFVAVMYEVPWCKEHSGDVSIGNRSSIQSKIYMCVRIQYRLLYSASLLQHASLCPLLQIARKSTSSVFWDVTSCSPLKVDPEDGGDVPPKHRFTLMDYMVL